MIHSSRVLVTIGAFIAFIAVTGANRSTRAAPTVRLVEASWYRQAQLIADRQMLAGAFRRAGYQPPPHAYLLAARVMPGVGQLAFQYFSLDDTAFTYSAPDNYWPASTVKLMAAVGALWTLGKHGLTGDAVVELTDADGHYKGPVHAIYDKALGMSTNPEYNRLMLIAGYDELNGEYLVERYGMPRTVLQRRYGHRRPGLDRELRSSPEIRFWQGAKQGTIAARTGKLQHPECPDKGNCTSLFELQEALRRLALHGEIPPSERFPIGRTDRRRLMRALIKAKNKLGDGAARALGHPVTIYNKAGRFPGDDHLDNALVVDEVTKRRYMVAMSVPYSSPKEPDSVTYDQLVELGRQTLIALASRRARHGPALQLGAGVPITIAPSIGDGSQLRLAIGAGPPRRSRRARPRLRVWLDGRLLRPGKPGSYAADAGPGDHLLVVEARRGRRASGYRTALLRVDP